MRKKQQAFTLVEMLVVIAIILLLIALALPALTNAQEKGHRVACIGNLRQLYLAYHQYTEENRWVTPRGYSGINWTTGTWREFIEPYHRDRRIYLCPSAINVSGRNITATGTYGVNAWIGQNAYASEGRESPWYLIANLAKSVCIGENEEGDWVVEPIQGIGGTRALWPQPGWFYSRHGQGANAVFFDGHLQWTTVTEAHANNSEWFLIR